MHKNNAESLSPFKQDDELAFLAGIRLRETGYDFQACFLWSCGQCGCVDVAKVTPVICLCLSGWIMSHESLTGETCESLRSISAACYRDGIPQERLSAKQLTSFINGLRNTTA